MKKPAKSGQVIGTELIVDASPITLQRALEQLGLSDDTIEPMPCCGLTVPLGDTSFGTEVFCNFGRCVRFICECGHCWASVETFGCRCREGIA